MTAGIAAPVLAAGTGAVLGASAGAFFATKGVALCLLSNSEIKSGVWRLKACCECPKVWTAACVERYDVDLGINIQKLVRELHVFLPVRVVRVIVAGLISYGMVFSINGMKS